MLCASLCLGSYSWHKVSQFLLGILWVKIEYINGICLHDSDIVTDLNECALTSTNNCTQSCTNSIGGYTCSCLNGYTLAADGFTCNGWYLVTSITFGVYHIFMCITFHSNLELLVVHISSVVKPFICDQEVVNVSRICDMRWKILYTMSCTNILYMWKITKEV